MANRKLPFGYMLQDGRICICDAEAKCVRWIFEQYASGSSYDALATSLNTGNVPYCPDKSWNKHMVARILKQEEYCKNERYPLLIDSALCNTVQAKSRPTGTTASHNEPYRDIAQIIHCDTCNAVLHRDSKNSGRPRWTCPVCGQRLGAKASVKMLQNIVHLQNHLIKHPERIVAVVPADDSPEAMRLENEFWRELDRPNHNENAARELALALAAAQFAQLGNEAYETQRLQHLLGSAEDGEEINGPLLRSAVKAIHAHSDGEISLLLKNGQRIERRNEI